MKIVLKNIFFTLVTITFVIVLVMVGEILVKVTIDKINAVRLEKAALYEPGEEKKWQKDSIMHHRHTPLARFTYVASDRKEFRQIVEYNSKGLNDYEYDYEKPENTLRILVFGDSFVEACQVKKEDNFCKILEKKLNSLDLEQKYEVINMGVSAYSPILEYLYLKHEGLKYDPDLIIVCFFINDVHDDLSYKDSAEFDKNNLPTRIKWREPDRTKELKGWKRFERELCSGVKKLLHKSKIYVFFKKKAYQLLAFLKLKELHPESESMFILYDETSPKETEAWQDTLQYIRGIKKLASENNAEFMLVTIPLEAELSKNPKLDSLRFYFVGKLDSSRHEKIIKEFCEENDINCVNLLREFDGFKVGELYFQKDGHFNQRGHGEVASILLNKMDLFGLIKESINQ